jgi:shikimate kinase
MGSGKSTIGRSVAAALERRFVDNDEQVLAATGMTAAELSERDGIDALHHAEAEALLDALRAPAASVIAAAASTIVDPSVRRALQQHAFVVWLRAAPTILAARMPRSPTRPFGRVDPARLVAQQSRDRDPLFAQIADLTVESDASTPDEVVKRVLAGLPNAENHDA